MNHHSPDVTASDTTANRPSPTTPSRAVRTPPSSAMEPRIAARHAAPRQ